MADVARRMMPIVATTRIGTSGSKLATGLPGTEHNGPEEYHPGERALT
jgi:hypothetical protein